MIDKKKDTLLLDEELDGIAGGTEREIEALAKEILLKMPKGEIANMQHLFGSATGAWLIKSLANKINPDFHVKCNFDGKNVYEYKGHEIEHEQAVHLIRTGRLRD